MGLLLWVGERSDLAEAMRNEQFSTSASVLTPQKTCATHFVDDLILNENCIDAALSTVAVG